MRPFCDPHVAATFDSYPTAIRKKLLAIRELIFTTAAKHQVGELEETLKWGEPAYLTAQSGAGTTIRLAWKNAQPSHYALYVNCQTTLIETFRTLFAGELNFVGNRGIVFGSGDVVPRDALGLCIAAALTYHRNKNAPASAKTNGQRNQERATRPTTKRPSKRASRDVKVDPKLLGA